MFTSMEWVFSDHVRIIFISMFEPCLGQVPLSSTSSLARALKFSRLNQNFLRFTSVEWVLSFFGSRCLLVFLKQEVNWGSQDMP